MNKVYEWREKKIFLRLKLNKFPLVRFPRGDFCDQNFAIELINFKSSLFFEHCYLSRTQELEEMKEKISRNKKKQDSDRKKKSTISIVF